MGERYELNYINKGFIITLLFFILVGCSFIDNATLEEKIIGVLKSSEGKDFEKVIDYDIKDEFIVVIYKSRNYEQLNIGFIKSNNGGLEWEIGIGGPELTGGGSFISEPLNVNVIIPKEKAVKEVKVFGEVAKLVRYSDDIEYWISFTDKSPNSLDVEYIK